MAKGASAWNRFWEPQKILVILVLAACSFLGGSSRPDVPALLILRPLLVVGLVGAVLFSDLPARATLRWPFRLILILALAILWQLIPLPFSAPSEQALPIVSKSWRPLSLTPDNGWNSLLALLPALGALVGFSVLDSRQARHVLSFIIAVAAASAVLGVIQLLSGELYFYEFTHRGLPVGFLANRNHQAALLAVAIPLIRAWMLMPEASAERARVRDTTGLMLCAMLVVLILVTGSRSGMLLAGLGVLGAVLVKPQLPFRQLSVLLRWTIAGVLLGVVVGLVTLTASFGRALSIDRLLDIDIPETELRVANTPTMLRIIRDHFWTGTGFGSFDPVFRSYEPDAVLHYSYYNNAHNDLFELLITGGAPALLVLLLFLAWYARATYRAFFGSAPGSLRYPARAAAIAIAMFLIASLTDYPLRTPLIGAIFALLCAYLAQMDSSDVEKTRTGWLQLGRPQATQPPPITKRVFVNQQRTFSRSVALACVASVLLASCASEKFVGRPDLEFIPAGELPPPTRADLVVPARPYAIGPSDQLAVDVFGVPELSRNVNVDLTGRISLPLLGSIEASGLTASELVDRITKDLRGRYVRDPRVSVNIITAANQVFTVDGAVTTPGIYPVSGRMSLMRAIARASSTTEFAKENYVVVFREANHRHYAALYDLRAIRQGAYPDPEIFSNDVIVVGESRARRVFKDIISAAPLITTPIIALLR